MHPQHEHKAEENWVQYRSNGKMKIVSDQFIAVMLGVAPILQLLQLKQPTRYGCAEHYITFITCDFHCLDTDMKNSTRADRVSVRSA